MTQRSNNLTDSVREAFRRSGLSVKRLSVLSGVPYASAHAFVAGDRDPRASTLEKLAAALGLTLCAVQQPKRK